MRAVVLSGVFAIAWFLTLFCLLPMRLGGGVDPETGAPVQSRIAWKFLIATFAAAAALGIFYAMILIGWLDI